MDKDKNIIDLLNAKPDLNKKIIKTVGNPRYRLKEDALRILRAIRFATILNFDIEPKTRIYIKRYSNLLNNLSKNRVKQELDKIFINANKEKGINLLIELKLIKPLKLDNLKDITPCNDLIGIWTQINVDDVYPFTKVEKEHMKKIRELLSKDIHDQYNIYKYGLYIGTVAYQIKKESVSTLNKIYNNLPIKQPKDISINTIEISKLLNKKPGSYLRDIINDIEKQIIYNKIPNEEQKIKEYILNNYK